MTRTQILLPDELYRRAKQFSESREMSLAEITRRGIELFLARYPDPQASRPAAALPTFDGGRLLVPLDQLGVFAHDEESSRGRITR